MPNFKQVQINSAELRNYIELIARRVSENGLILADYAKKLDPPFPFQILQENHDTGQFFLAELELVCHTALLAMAKEMKNIPQRDWEICLKEQAALKSVDPRSANRYEGIENPQFTDEMLKLCDTIGNYFNTREPKPQYLFRKDAVNPRVVISIAIIWLGRQLAKEKAAEAESPQIS